MGRANATSLSFRARTIIIFGSLLTSIIVFSMLQNKALVQYIKSTTAILVEYGNNYQLLFKYYTTINGTHTYEHFSTNLNKNPTLFDCNWTKTTMDICNQRLCASLSCKSPVPDIIFQLVSNDTQPSQYEYNDPCLDSVIKRKCHNGTSIPKVVHFVQFGRREFPYYGMLSVISAFRFVQPCLILIHGDYLPWGRYWNIVVTKVPNILFIHRQKPTSIFGHEIRVVEHSADVARLEAVRRKNEFHMIIGNVFLPEYYVASNAKELKYIYVIRFGGIYMDTDHVIINPLDQLLNYSVVMSVETEGLAIGNGMFLGKPGAKFFDIWYDTYQSFNDTEWGAHSVIMPFKLNKMFPHIGLHLEKNLFKPYDRISMHHMYNANYNWTILYGVHLYARLNKHYLNEKLETFNSSMGEIVRRILFGNHMSCFVKK